VAQLQNGSARSPGLCGAARPRSPQPRRALRAIPDVTVAADVRPRVRSGPCIAVQSRANGSAPKVHNRCPARSSGRRGVCRRRYPNPGAGLPSVLTSLRLALLQRLHNQPTSIRSAVGQSLNPVGSTFAIVLLSQWGPRRCRFSCSAAPAPRLRPQSLRQLSGSLPSSAIDLKRNGAARRRFEAALRSDVCALVGRWDEGLARYVRRRTYISTARAHHLT
jgi:hypothetical protein